MDPPLFRPLLFEGQYDLNICFCTGLLSALGIRGVANAKCRPFDTFRGEEPALLFILLDNNEPPFDR